MPVVIQKQNYINRRANTYNKFVQRSVRFQITFFISYPLAASEESEAAPDSLLSPLIELVQDIARWSLLSGFLIRGGITIGKLYHNATQGVVFGEALVEAYNLESKDAIYPRVISRLTLCHVWLYPRKCLYRLSRIGMPRNRIKAYKQRLRWDSLSELSAWDNYECR